MELQYKICFVKAKQCSPIYFFHLIIPLKVHDIELDWLRSVNDIAELSSVNETAESIFNLTPSNFTQIIF